MTQWSPAPNFSSWSGVIQILQLPISYPVSAESMNHESRLSNSQHQLLESWPCSQHHLLSQLTPWTLNPDSPAPNISSWLSWLHESWIPIFQLPTSAPGSADSMNLWWSEFSCSLHQLLSQLTPFIIWQSRLSGFQQHLGAQQTPWSMVNPDSPAPSIGSCLSWFRESMSNSDSSAFNIICLYEPWWIQTIQLPTLSPVTADSMNLRWTPNLQIPTSAPVSTESRLTSPQHQLLSQLISLIMVNPYSPDPNRSSCLSWLHESWWTLTLQIPSQHKLLPQLTPWIMVNYDSQDPIEAPVSADSMNHWWIPTLQLSTSSPASADSMNHWWIPTLQLSTSSPASAHPTNLRWTQTDLPQHQQLAQPTHSTWLWW